MDLGSEVLVYEMGRWGLGCYVGVWVKIGVFWVELWFGLLWDGFLDLYVMKI